MQSTSSIDPSSSVPEALNKFAYQTFQWGKNYFGLAHKALSTQLLNITHSTEKQSTKPIDMATLQRVQQRFDQLLEQDWKDAKQGVYPASLLFDNPWEDFFRYYPSVWLDLPQMWERANQKRYQDFSPGIEVEGYPQYYLRNFHHQTDGYLSDASANLYDLQVEILFGGTADPMRRRILAPLKQALGTLADTSARQLRILDIACGTGRTLKLLRAAFPQAALFGTDLSPAYLRKANQLLSQNPGELPQLLQANSESLPYLDNYFHALTSVFLFHELPGPVRQKVIDECFRIVMPGGMFAICDSIQISDSAELMPMLENFPEMFHEPFYRHYIADNIEERLEKAGFTEIHTEVHFMSKYWFARKPA